MRQIDELKALVAAGSGVEANQLEKIKAGGGHLTLARAPSLNLALALALALSLALALALALALTLTLALALALTQPLSLTRWARYPRRRGGTAGTRRC